MKDEIGSARRMKEIFGLFDGDILHSRVEPQESRREWPNVCETEPQAGQSMPLLYFGTLKQVSLRVASRRFSTNYTS
jgi:hypothetical protein